MNYGSALFSGSATRCPLNRNISAIQVTTEPDGHTRLGAISQLPQGAVPEICGEGFNQQTVKVRWEGVSYFVFREDLKIEPKLRVMRAGAH